MADEAVNAHKLMAEGKPYPSGDFGVEKLGSKSVNGPASGKETRLHDDARGARSPIKGNQANPDHGWK